MTDVKKLIKKVRGQAPKIKTFSRMRLIIANARSEQERKELWEADKKVVRTQNFEKAQRALEQKKEEQAAEEQRKSEIAEQRLKNLKKARRAKRRVQNVK